MSDDGGSYALRRGPVPASDQHLCRELFPATSEERGCEPVMQRSWDPREAKW
ncbi:unnamed protein product, partial [Amoebophrya sp. A120]|eukprot:GSA120T00019622001.1